MARPPKEAFGHPKNFLNTSGLLFANRRFHWEFYILGVPKLGCFKSGCLQFLHGTALCALLRSLVRFYSLWHSFAVLRLRSFALILLHSSAHFHTFLRPTVFQMTMFGNFRKTVSKGRHPTQHLYMFVLADILLKYERITQRMSWEMLGEGAKVLKLETNCSDFGGGMASGIIT